MTFGVSVNFLSVLVAAIASMIIGSLWYGPIFGKQWMNLIGLKKSDMKKMKMSPQLAMFLGLVGSLITAYFLSVFVGVVGANTISSGASLGFWVWLGFMMPLNAGVFLWEGKSSKLFLLNTVYFLISTVVMSSIVAIW